MGNDNNKMHAVRIQVEGRVQGVGFRYFVYKNARKKGVSGWVKNLDGGRVEAHFEGSSEQIDALIALCEEGPAGAKVKQLTRQSSKVTGNGEDFDFKYD